MEKLLKTKAGNLLKDKNVRRWVENLNSESTKRIYLEALAKYCDFRELSPLQIVNEFKSDQDKGENYLQDFILDAKKKYAPKVVNNLLVGNKSWLRHNGLEVIRKISVGNVRLTPTIQDEHPPDQKQLRKILDLADIRGKATIALIAFAGLRPTTASGLKLKNLPELKIQGKKVMFEKIPTMVKVPMTLSKNRRPYFSFLIDEGCGYLQAYLEKRLRLGEKLMPDSPVLTIAERSRYKTFSRRAFQSLIKRVFKNADFPFRPYVLRSYFDVAMMNARGLQYDIQQFLMGHSGSIEAVYTTNKNLPESQIEKMREDFKNLVEHNLTTIPKATNPEIASLKTMVQTGIMNLNEMGLEKLKNIASLLGIPTSDLDLKSGGEAIKIGDGMISFPETTFSHERMLRAMIYHRLGLRPEKDEYGQEIPKNEPNGNGKYLVINETELPIFLEKGYKPIHNTPSGKIVMIL